jgi:hypothetical protein
MRALVLEVYQAPSPYPLPQLIVGEGIKAAVVANCWHEARSLICSN